MIAYGPTWTQNVQAGNLDVLLDTARRQGNAPSRLDPALVAKGWQVIEADAAPSNQSGIISIHRPDADLAWTQARLAEARIATSLRTDHSGQRYRRLSPHFYNTDTEMAGVIELQYNNGRERRAPVSWQFSLETLEESWHTRRINRMNSLKARGLASPAYDDTGR